MFLTGFADEAGSQIEIQVRAIRELGWRHLESRAVGTKNLATLSEPEFEQFCQVLADNRIAVNCYGSGIANFRRNPRDDGDFEASKAELLAAIPRMRKLGIGLLRGMSFRNPRGEESDSPELEQIIFRKVRELVRICEDAGIVYGHENCMNYGGLSYSHTLKLLDQVKSDSFKLIFDTGNPLARRQSAWEFYSNVREFIVYVHIKDAVPQIPGQMYLNYCFPGDGCADLRPILRDLKEYGYDGGFSIEPHMAINYQDRVQPSAEALAAFKYENFIRYGRKLEALLLECGWELNSN